MSDNIKAGMVVVLIILLVAWVAAVMAAAIVTGGYTEACRLAGWDYAEAVSLKPHCVRRVPVETVLAPLRTPTP